MARGFRAAAGTLTDLGISACALLAAAAVSPGETWRHRQATRGLVQQVLALHNHVAPSPAADSQPLTEALLMRRGWALSCLNELGDSAAQAVEIGEPLLADRVRVLGEGHPGTLMSRNNLAYAYGEAGRAGDAVPLFEEALAGLERVLGADHPDTVLVRRNLESARASLGGGGGGVAG